MAVGLGSVANASLIGGGPPGPGLGGDDGASLFIPNLNPKYDRHIVLVKEALDPVLSSIPHEWGFYFASDPGTLYPILTAADQAPPEQIAVIDFDNGRVVDMDVMFAIESTFTPSLGTFGFYLRVDFPTGNLLTYSDPALNGGTDTFASFPYLANPLFREVAFEVREQLLSLEVVDGAIPVPEPATLAMLAGGIAVLASRRRA